MAYSVKEKVGIQTPLVPTAIKLILLVAITLTIADILLRWKLSAENYQSAVNKEISIDELKPNSAESEEDVWLSELMENRTDASCSNIAREVREPYSDEYRNQTIDLDGPVYAFHTWNQPINKSMIELQKHQKIGHCRQVFKVKDRKLYIYQESECYKNIKTQGIPNQIGRTKHAIELILVTLYVYDVPDVDFVVELGDNYRDNKANGLPVMAYCVGPSPALFQPGFTLPSYGAYTSALGRVQYDVFKKCLEKRYPLDRSRKNKAVWRGSTTGDPMKNGEDLLENRRISLSRIGQLYPELFDARIARVAQNFDDQVMEFLEERAGPLVDRMPSEQYNEFASVIDLDGNAWSDRFHTLLSSNTPILKQEHKEFVEYFGHLVEDEKHVKFFDFNLVDLPTIVEDRMTNWDSELEKMKAQVRNANEFAAEHVSQTGVLRAMAYSMTKHASFLTYKVEDEEGYVEITPEVCCECNRRLPPEIVQAITGRYS